MTATASLAPDLLERTVPAPRAAWAAPMKRFIKTLGTGRHLGKNLSPEDAAEAMRLILSGGATEAQIGAFFAALRVQEETAEELVAFTEAARGMASHLPPGVAVDLDIAEAYDGKERTVPVSPAAAFLCAGAGLRVLLHGSHDIPAKYGVTAGRILAHLGAPTDDPPGDAARGLATAGVAYLHARHCAPRIEALKPIRQQLGLRTALNTVEKLLDHGRAGAHLVGAFHGSVLEKLARVLVGLGHTRGAVIQGTEASCDPSPSRRTRIIRIDAGRIDPLELEPQDVGLPATPDPPHPPGGPAACATMIAATLAGAPTPVRNPALLTASVWLWLAGRAETPRGGLALALQSLESGAAHARLRAAQGEPRLGLAKRATLSYPFCEIGSTS